MGLDIGERRIGVAVSDATGTLARPVRVLQVASLDADGLRVALAEVERFAAEEDGLSAVVIGLPHRLDGTPGDLAPKVRALAAALGAAAGLPVVLQDERLTSREAESRLAITDKDWRSRKRRLDAAAAAILLQDYLDASRARTGPLVTTSDADA